MKKQHFFLTIILFTAYSYTLQAANQDIIQQLGHPHALQIRQRDPQKWNAMKAELEKKACKYTKRGKNILHVKISPCCIS